MMIERDLYKKSVIRKAYIASFLIHIILVGFLFFPFLNIFKKPDFQSVFVDFEYVEATEVIEIMKTNNENKVSEARNTSSNVTGTESDRLSGARTEASLSASPEAIEQNSPIQGGAKVQQDAEARKRSFADLFGKGDESEKINNALSDNDNEEIANDTELNKGTGRVSGGLAGRGVIFAPTIYDNSQKKGRIALEICVNEKGDVVSSKFTQKGSTTSDDYLISVARKSSLNYTFSQSEVPLQCGVLHIDFRIQ